MQFDSLELQKNIEEKRLVYGSKLYRFLLDRFAFLSNFISRLVASKGFLLYGILLIFLSGIFFRSIKDVGTYSSFYLEFGEKLLRGGKYYTDLFIYDSPFSLYLSAIPTILAKIFSINKLLAAEIFYDLIGIITIIATSLILKKSKLSSSQKSYNLILLSFTAGYFLRLFDTQSNEFIGSVNYFLLFAYPFIAYHFPRANVFTYFQKTIIAILAAFIFYLSPAYFLLPLTFLLGSVFQHKSFKSLIAIENIICLALLAIYLALLVEFQPQYFLVLKLLYIIEQPGLLSMLNNVAYMVIYNIFPLLLLLVVTYQEIKANKLTKILLLSFISGALITIASLINEYNQISIFYSLALPLMLIITFIIFENKKINFEKYWFLIGSIIITFLFDVKNFAKFSFNLVILWWIFYLFLCWRWHRFFKSNQTNISDPKLRKIADILLLNNWFLRVSFLFLSLITIAFSFFPSFYYLNYCLCFLIWGGMVFFHQELYKKLVSGYFDVLSVVVIFIILAYYLGVMLVGIFNYQNLLTSIDSPNKSTSEIIRVVKNYAPTSQDKIVIASSQISASYPLFSYLSKQNPLNIGDLSLLTDNIVINQKVKKDLFENLKKAISDENNQLIIVYKQNSLQQKICQIGFLEDYFKDEEFKKVFFNNYNFLTRITYSKHVTKDDISFIQESDKLNKEYQKKLENLKNNREDIAVDIEVYNKIN